MIAFLITFGLINVTLIIVFSVVLIQALKGHNEALVKLIDQAYQERNNLYNRIQTPNAAEAQLLSFPKPEEPPNNYYSIDTDAADGITIEKTDTQTPVI